MPNINRKESKTLNGNKKGSSLTLQKIKNGKPPAKIQIPKVPKRQIKEKPMYLEKIKPKPPSEENNLFA